MAIKFERIHRNVTVRYRDGKGVSCEDAVRTIVRALHDGTVIVRSETATEGHLIASEEYHFEPEQGVMHMAMKIANELEYRPWGILRDSSPFEVFYDNADCGQAIAWQFIDAVIDNAKAIGLAPSDVMQFPWFEYARECESEELDEL